MTEFCNACPRACNVDRSHAVGFCGVPNEFRIARAALHPWEEPSVSGSKGSGTVFFCGCNLRCIFCQNGRISRCLQQGAAVSPARLEEILLELQEAGAANVNLVTPSHYAEQLIPVLRSVRPRLRIPVVWNSGGFESAETLRRLEGLVDVYLPDCKFFDPVLSRDYAAAPDYFAVASEAIAEMLRQVGAPVIGGDGLIQSGVILRHLVLPGCRKDSIRLLRALKERFGTDAFLLSLMSQYTPEFAPDTAPKALRRRLTSFEYDSVLQEALRLGFNGYLQSGSSAVSDYTPTFGDEDLKNL